MIKIAIVSDLHCHPKRDSEKKENDNTYLFSDILRTHDHPIENLINVLENEDVDYILCPGDITDKSDTQGFVSGWNYLLELKEHFKARKIIATIGNHDVDSRGNNDTYSYKNVKGIKKNYPFENNHQKIINEFFANGFTVIEEADILFLVIDSCFYHHNKEESPNGKILIDTIKEIESSIKNITNDKYKILLLHHHPLTHSRKGLGENDTLTNGDKLIDLATKNNFDLIIHGHKHDPQLRFENNIHILSSGSFSATSNLQYTSDRNMFHIVELHEKSKGQIRTWTYLPHNGWSINYDASSDLPPICGFGTENINNIKSEIVTHFPNIGITNWEDVENKIKSIKYLNKNELSELIEKLSAESYRVSTDTRINYPKELIKIQPND